LHWLPWPRCLSCKVQQRQVLTQRAVPLQELARLEERSGLLEHELRARKREGEKLQALHFRLRNDLMESGGDLR